MSKSYLLFMIAVAGMGVASGIHETSFNNYLSELFSIGASTRGMLEFPRELPGLLGVFIAGALMGFGQIRVAAIAAGALTLGLMGLGFLSPSFHLMVFWMIIWSIGNHLFMPLEGSIAVALSGKEGVGTILGKIGSIRLLATLIGATVIWFALGDRLPSIGFHHTYFLAAVCGLLAFITLFFMPKLTLTRPQAKLVWKKEYRFFYFLCFFWGIRKQIFITFAPWLLVHSFLQNASVIAQLWIITSLIGVFFRPFLGRLTDKYGERLLLLGEIPLLILIFLGYGIAPNLPSGGLLLVMGCYILDSLLMGMPLVRTSYVSKILTEKDHLAPTLAMGVSLDHVSSMTMPILGGLLWSGYSPFYLFSFAIFFLLLNGVIVLLGVPKPLHPTGLGSSSNR